MPPDLDQLSRRPLRVPGFSQQPTPQQQQGAPGFGSPLTKPGQFGAPQQHQTRPGRPTPRSGSGNQLFGGYTPDQLRANPALVARLGPNAAARWAASNPAKPPGAQPPATPPKPPAPAPFVPQGPNQGGWAPPPAFVPPSGQFSSGLPGAVPEPYAFNDPFNSLLAAVPLMNLNRDQQIGDAMASAGFSGNRFGSFAAGKAAEIGAQNALAQNALLLDTLTNYANRSEDRALQATGMGMGLGNLLDQMQQSRLQLPFAIGGWEQGRQDQFANQVYQDFERNKMGWLPMLLQAAMSQGSGTPGQIVPITSQPAQPGLVDWLSIFGSLF